jgi:hypothetical protein
MRRRSIGLEALAALLILAPWAPARANVPPPPIDPATTKHVPATIEVDDWGPLADRVSTKRVVAPDETLRMIAAQELGDASHWKAIADVNPDVAANPDKIAAGTTLWLPSRASLEKAPATGATAGTKSPGFAPWYDVFWTSFRPKQGTRDRATQLLGRATPGEVPAEAKERAQLLFVPHEQAAALLAVVGKPPEDIAPLIKDARPLRVDLHPDTLLHKDDPTVRIVTRFALRGVDGIWTARERVRYDATGQVVTKEWPLRASSHEPGKPLPGKDPPPGQ